MMAHSRTFNVMRPKKARAWLSLLGTGWLLTAGAGLALAGLSGCRAAPPDLSTRLHATEVAPERVAEWILQGRNDFLMVDLRSESEVKAGAIPGAVRLAPEDLQVGLKKLPDYKKLVFVSASGLPDKAVLEAALLQGHHVLALKDGFAGWQASVLTAPSADAGLTPEAFARRDTVAKYFRGEPTLGDASQAGAAPRPVAPVAAGFVQAAPSAGAPVKKEGC